MRSFVLVHGGLHGGWCWRRLRPLLIAAGYEVHTPTLTGLGERAHLAGPEIDLLTHIQDVVACIESEELHDVVLVGHSYGGMVVTGAADRLGDRIAQLIYLDALVPHDGQSVADLDPGLAAAAEQLAGGFFPAAGDYRFGLEAEQDLRWIRRRLTPQSVATMTQGLSIQSDLSTISRSYIECDDLPGDMPLPAIRRIAAQVRTDPAWRYRKLAAGHDCMISEPHATAAVLLELVEGAPPIRLEPKARAFLDVIAATGIPPMEQGSPEMARAAMKQVRRAIAPPDLARVEDVKVGAKATIPARLYVPVGAIRAALLYFHGGGWVVGSVDDSDGFARTLAAATGCAVLSVDYRLAPEHPFPAAIEDGMAAFSWLAAHSEAVLGCADLPIGLIGDSAGATIATVVGSAAEGRNRAAFQILAYPVTDGAMATRSWALPREGMLLTPALMRWFWSHYAADDTVRLHPQASPLRAASHAGAPPTLILLPENDILRDEGWAYAAALAADGVDVVCKAYPGQIHGFLTLVGQFDGTATALADIAAFIARRTAAANIGRTQTIR